MKYIAKKGTAIYETLLAMRERITAANKAAKNLAVKHGWDQWAAGIDCVGGGISGVVFDNQPAGWKRVQSKQKVVLYYPKTNVTALRELRAELEELPRVSNWDYNSTVRGSWPLGRFGLDEGRDCFLLSIPESWEIEEGDLVEITNREFEELKTTR